MANTASNPGATQGALTDLFTPKLVTVLREYRGDCHVAVLTARGLGGAAANVLAEACGLTDGRQQAVRGWSDAAWHDARALLEQRGWVGEEGATDTVGVGEGQDQRMIVYEDHRGTAATHTYPFNFFFGHLPVLLHPGTPRRVLHICFGVGNSLSAVAAHEETGGAHVYNLGTDETIVLDDSVATIVEHLGLEPAIEHTGGKRGWAGDSPLIHLDCAKVRALGWEPTLDIQAAIRRTLDWFEAHPEIVLDPAGSTI